MPAGVSLEGKIDMVKDPVCGMQVAKDSQCRYVHLGTTHFFCSEHCLASFRQAPQSYLSELQKIRASSP